jgi:hypothetical protein
MVVWAAVGTLIGTRAADRGVKMTSVIAGLERRAGRGRSAAAWRKRRAGPVLSAEVAALGGAALADFSASGLCSTAVAGHFGKESGKSWNGRNVWGGQMLCLDSDTDQFFRNLPAGFTRLSAGGFPPGRFAFACTAEVTLYPSYKIRS